MLVVKPLFPAMLFGVEVGSHVLHEALYEAEIWANYLSNAQANHCLQSR